jgi:hypothetical protein
MVAEKERKVTDNVNPDKVASYLIKWGLWERAEGEDRFNFRVTDSKTKNLNMQAATKAHKDLCLEKKSLAESEQKLAQVILDDDDLYEHLRKAKLNPELFKEQANRILKSLGIEPSDKQLLTETTNPQLQKWFTT